MGGAESGGVTESMDDELQAKHVAGLPADSRNQLIQLFRVRPAPGGQVYRKGCGRSVYRSVYLPSRSGSLFSWSKGR